MGRPVLCWRENSRNTDWRVCLVQNHNLKYQKIKMEWTENLLDFYFEGKHYHVTTIYERPLVIQNQKGYMNPYPCYLYSAYLVHIYRLCDNCYLKSKIKVRISRQSYLEVILVSAWSFVNEPLHCRLCAQVQPDYRQNTTFTYKPKISTSTFKAFILVAKHHVSRWFSNWDPENNRGP